MLLRSWGEIDLDLIGLQINSLEKWLYKSYEPDKFSDGDFQQRLIKWLDNVASEADKKTLFSLLPNLFYIGPVEFEELYRCAYDGPIARWLITSETYRLWRCVKVIASFDNMCLASGTSRLSASTKATAIMSE